MFKFGEFAQFTPEGSWKVLKVSENVWKATHILRFIMVYHHLEPFFLYEHGQFGIPCFWTKPWSMFRQTPTGGCLACLLPSCSEQHQDFCHILQPRGFLFQQTWGWVKNLWNTIVPYLGGWRIFVYQQFWCEGYQGFDPQRRPTLPSVSVTTTGQIRSLLVDIEQGHGGLTRQVDGQI